MDRLTYQQRVRLKLVKKFNLPVVTLSLNIPRDCPQSEDFSVVFSEGLREFRLQRLNVVRHIVHPSERFAAIAVNAEARSLKRLLMFLERRHPIGRLWDFDVYVGQECISGESLGRELRNCFLCNERALVCRRLAKHSREDVYEWVLSRAHSFAQCVSQLSNRVEIVAREAHRAIVREARLSPKPGLVDERSSGVHRDMDLSLLLASADAIAPYLAHCTKLAAQRAMRGIDCPRALMGRLRAIGIEAEKAMFSVTKGVNTHKGMIFSIGLLCGAAGTLIGQGRELKPRDVCEMAARVAKGVSDHFYSLPPSSRTKGEENFLNYQSLGIRGEAENGFQSVLGKALPELARARVRFDDDFAAIRALLALMTVVDDSNVLYRAGSEGLRNMQQLAKQVLDSSWPDGANSEDLFAQLEDFCKHLSISPGGSADLLAVALFLDAIVLSC